MIFIIILLIGSQSLTAAEENVEKYKLELLQIFFRHGDRTPKISEIYPTDPYDPSAYEPFGLGQLTNIGKRREYEVGQVLRERYGKFLGDTYKSDKIYAYCTDADRTKMSLQLVLASLYTPNDLLKWNETLNWIPIPIAYNPTELDFLSTSKSCSKYEELLRKASKSPEAQKKIAKFEKTYRYIMNNTGLSEKEFLTVTTVLNNVQALKSMGLAPPDWLSEAVYEELKEMVDLAYEIMSFTPAMRKIGSGPTIRRIINNIQNHEFGNDTRQIYLYGVHGKNVGALLRAHGITFPKVPKFGTAAIFEKLRGADNNVYVRIIVWTGMDRQMVPLKVKGCGEICPWKKYLKIVGPVVPRGTGMECALSQLNVTSLSNIVNGVANDEFSFARLLCGDDVYSFKYANKHFKVPT